MAWSVALACASIGEPRVAFRPGLVPDRRAATDFAHLLYPSAELYEAGDTVLDFALWPYEDELFVGAYGGGTGTEALVVCDRRFFGVDDEARRLADRIATALPGSSCGVLVLHSIVSGCWFRWYEGGTAGRDVFVTAEDGVVVDLGSRLPAEDPFWRPIDDGGADVPLPFEYEEYGLELARAHMFGRAIGHRDTDGFLPLELPVRRFKVS